MEDEVKLEETVVVEEVKQPEVTEVVVEEEVKVEDVSNQVDEYKALIEKQTKNFNEIQSMLQKEQEKVKNLEELVKTNEELKKQYDASEATRIKVESENEKAKLLDIIKSKDSEVLEVKKQLESVKKQKEFDDYKRNLELKYSSNTLVLDGIKMATNKKEIDFVVKTYDKQSVEDLSKMQAVAGTNAMADVNVVKNEGSVDWDAYFDKINAERGRK
jgi:hypothetical protein